MLVDIPLYPYEFFVFNDLVMSSVSLDDTHLNFKSGKGWVKALYKYVLEFAQFDIWQFLWTADTK
jgi:hypothetical protein